MKLAFPDWQERISLVWEHRWDWEGMDRMRCQYSRAHESDKSEVRAAAPDDFFVGMATTLRDLISQPRELMHSEVSAPSKSTGASSSAAADSSSSPELLTTAAVHSSAAKQIHLQRKSDVALENGQNAVCEPSSPSSSSCIAETIDSGSVGVFEETLTNNSFSPSAPKVNKGEEKGCKPLRRSRYFSSATTGSVRAPLGNRSSAAASSCCGGSKGLSAATGLSCVCRDEKKEEVLQRSVSRVEIAYDTCNDSSLPRPSEEVGASVDVTSQKKETKDSPKPAKRKVRVVKKKTTGGSTAGLKRQKKRPNKKNPTPDRVSKAVARARTTSSPHSAAGRRAFTSFTTSDDDDSDSDDFMPSQPPLRLRC